jgi:hypothetical protein
MKRKLGRRRLPPEQRVLQIEVHRLVPRELGFRRVTCRLVSLIFASYR